MITYVHTARSIYVIIEGYVKNIQYPVVVSGPSAENQDDDEIKRGFIPGMEPLLGCRVTAEVSHDKGRSWEVIDLPAAKEVIDSEPVRLVLLPGKSRLCSEPVTEIEEVESEQIPPSITPEIIDRVSELPEETSTSTSVSRAQPPPLPQRRSSPDMMFAVMQRRASESADPVDDGWDELSN